MKSVMPAIVPAIVLAIMKRAMRRLRRRMGLRSGSGSWISLKLRSSVMKSESYAIESGISISPINDRSNSRQPSAWARSIKADRSSGERDIGIEKGEL